METSHFENKHVSRRTGLNTRRISAWDCRDRAVIPLRTATHQRCFTETDIQRRQALDAPAGTAFRTALLDETMRDRRVNI